MSYCCTTQLHPNFSSKYQTYSALFAELGVTLSTPSGDGYVWKVTKGDHSIVFLSGSFPMNSSPAANIARDKLASCQVFADIGVDTPIGFAFFSEVHTGKRTFVESRFLVDHLDELLPATFSASEIEQGLIVKPGTESAGLGVQLCCGSDEIIAHAQSTLVHSHYGLVQEFIQGQEYRVAILGDEVLVTYRKRNPVILGDGKTPLSGLLRGICARLKDSVESSKTYQKLLRVAELSDLAADKTLADGEEVELELEVRNLSQGAWPEVVHNPPEGVVETALQAHRAVGLSYSGVDIKVRAGTEEPSVIEINANPGFTFLEKFQPDLAMLIQRKIAAQIVRKLHKGGVANTR